jgi:transcription elongation factor Elf1
VTSLRIMPEEKTTVLCPACKSRMSVRLLAHTMAENTDEFVYHCAMCDIEIKQQVPHLSTAPVSPPQAPKIPL